MRQVCYKIKDKDCKKLERFYNSLVKKYDSFEQKNVLTYDDVEKIEELESMINKLSGFFQTTTKKEAAAC
ncbi:MAG: hypothetical protein PHX44_08175 [Sulfurimonas sp.]|uniref:hypothetical protein n=1 Tax=Sulfurimonas sp. TaxID=2022749 RepID=UPI002614A16B|nr:hypothetical protein [Sulfurimonas sp.]MDD2653010.1 hypothetical protein [Sulfurimonas sp.]MDD3452456.1 hypothetical protein [Sulfurimonas sp.]